MIMARICVGAPPTGRPVTTWGREERRSHGGVTADARTMYWRSHGGCSGDVLDDTVCTAPEESIAVAMSLSARFVARVSQPLGDM